MNATWGSRVTLGLLEACRERDMSFGYIEFLGAMKSGIPRPKGLKKCSKPPTRDDHQQLYTIVIVDDYMVIYHEQSFLQFTKLTPYLECRFRTYTLSSTK